MKKFTLPIFLFLITLYSCKKEKLIIEDNHASQIININNNPDPSRVSLVDNDLTVDFTPEGNAVSSKGNTTKSSIFYQLMFKGKINSLQYNGESLGAIQVASMGNFFAVSYLKSGEEFAGGMDVFRLNNGVPQLLSTVQTPNADITSLTSGDGKFFIGTDLKTFESFNYQSPAVVGVVNVVGGSLNNPQIVPLTGFSVQDLVYNSANQKLYAATSTKGGLSVVSFNNNVGARTAYTAYDNLKSLAIAGNKITGCTGTEYANFDLTDGKLIGNASSWPIPNNYDQSSGKLNILQDGKLLFGNNNSLILVNPDNNTLLDEINVGGFVNSISIVNNLIYITTGNSILVAKINNDKEILILTKIHLYTSFPGVRFDVISVKVVGNYVIAACGPAGVYVFELTRALI
jgi:hypothetical protein